MIVGVRRLTPTYSNFVTPTYAVNPATAFKRIEGRYENLICAAVTSRQALIVKTVMTHWEELEE